MASAEKTSSHSTHPIGSSMTAVDVDKPLSPYFLPSAENPGITLVSQPLTAETYPHWSGSMTKALSAKNKLGFVDGSIPEPSDPNSPLSLFLFCYVIKKILLKKNRKKDTQSSSKQKQRGVSTISSMVEMQ